MTPKAVIFDCDGVVVDSEAPSFELLKQDLARHGLALSVSELQAMFLGGTVLGIFETCRSKGASLPNDWVQDFYARLYVVLAEGTPLIPGFLNFLRALELAGVPFAIGSNGSARKMEITLGQHPGLIQRFRGHIYSAQALGKPKPAPDLYLHAARALGFGPDDCVVIEDSANGAKAARAAGMRCMGYAPHGDAQALMDAGAIIFSDMNDLPRLLGFQPQVG